MKEYAEHIKDDTATDPAASARATLNLTQQTVKLAKFIQTECIHPGKWLVEISVSHHKGEPLTVKTTPMGTTKHLVIGE